MKVDVQELGACKRRLQVEEEPEVVRRAWEHAFSRVQKEARLPGFRKGKVPRSMIKIHFADDVKQEVARRLIPDVYRQALGETRIEPVEEPDLQEVRLEEGAPLSFAAVVEIKPTIELGTYVGLAAQHTPKPLADEEVDEVLGQLRERHAEYRAVERPADLGDLAIVDYTLTPEGMAPRAETGYGIVLGQGAVMPEIEEAVIGLGPGGSRQARVRFPDDHSNEALRGRAGEATVTVKEVKEKVLPPLDDDFARGMGPFESLEALRAELRKDLENRRARENRRALEDAVVEVLLAGHAFQVPDALVLRQVGHQIEHTRERLRQQGVDPDRLPWDYPKLLEEMRPGAERAVRRSLLLEAIAEKEGLAPGEPDVEAEVEKIARASQRPAAAVRSMMEKNGDLDTLRFSLREARTLDFLIEHARITS
ncbi:MAG: trigger factor [Candidatus Rokubacteria bacterium]|nr:trigger factor [Candidatus Rokubacteria bacterium]